MIYFQLFLSPVAVKQRNLTPKCFHLIYKHVKKIWYESLLHLWHLLRYNESIWRNFGTRSFIAETFLKNLEMDTWFHSQRNQSVDLHCKLIHWFLREWNSGLKRVKTFKRNLEVIQLCSQLTVKTPERLHWRRSGVFIANCEHISYLFPVFLWMTLKK